MRPAARITVVYVLLASAWILFSDLLVHAFVPPGTSELQISIAKGLAFVAITGSILFTMVRANVRALEEEARRVHATNEALIAQEGRLRLLSSAVEQSVSPMIITTVDQRIQYVNQAFLESTGRRREDVVGHHAMEFAMDDNPSSVPPSLVEALAAGRPWSGIIPNRRTDGTRFTWQTKVTPVHDAAGTVTHFLGVHEDITEKLAAQEAAAKAEALRQRSEHEYRKLFEVNPQPMWIFDPETLRFLTANEATTRRYGWTPEELEKMTILDIRPPEDRADIQRLARTPVSGFAQWSSVRHVTKSGEVRLVEVVSNDIQFRGQRARLVLAIDLTEQKKAEEALRANLQEKESLLKEIHHRVKNNLQIVSSMLYLQASRTQDKTSQHVLLESQARIRSMAMVHESLYGQGNLACIDLPRHIRNLCDYLGQSYGGRAPNVRIELDVAPVSLDLDRAVPLSLMVVELVSNALKYAFPEGRGGCVSVRFEKLTEQRYRLTVEDDGIGLPPGLEIGAGPSLGLKLVTTLARQLDGKVETSAGREAEMGEARGARFAIELGAEDRRKS